MLLTSPDAVTGARCWQRQRSQEGLTSAGWWELPGKAPESWPNSGWEEQASTQLEKLPGRDRPSPLNSAAAPATQSLGAGSGLGEMAARLGCWEPWEHGASGCIAPILPELIAGSFYCFSAAFESGEEKKKRLEKHFEKQGREKCPSFPAAPSPPPAANACQLCLPTLLQPRRRCCRARRVLSQSPDAAAECRDCRMDTPGCWEQGTALTAHPQMLPASKPRTGHCQKPPQ